MPRNEGSTKVKHEKRISEIVDLVLNGASPRDVKIYIAKKQDEQGTQWTPEEGYNKLSFSHIKLLIRKAHNEIINSEITNRRKNISISLARRERLFSESVKLGDIRTALAILRDISLLRGEYPDKYNSTNNVQVINNNQQYETIEQKTGIDPESIKELLNYFGIEYKPISGIVEQLPEICDRKSMDTKDTD